MNKDKNKRKQIIEKAMILSTFGHLGKTNYTMGLNYKKEKKEKKFKPLPRKIW